MLSVVIDKAKITTDSDMVKDRCQMTPGGMKQPPPLSSSWSENSDSSSIFAKNGPISGVIVTEKM